jgi:hypothetical protein
LKVGVSFGEVIMSIRSEIEEEQQRAEQEKKRREIEIAAIVKFANQKNIDISEAEKDRILHPENYDDWGYAK